MALAPINPTQLTPPRVALIDDRSGAISREWYRFFLSLLTATQTNQQETELAPDTSSLLASYDAMLADLAQTTETQPDATSLIASYDAMLETLTQTTESAPDCCSATASLESELNDLSQTVLTQPRAELGTMAALQQDNIPWLQFNTQPSGYPTGPEANGTVYWDDADSIKTLNIVMEDSGEVIQHVGEETYYRVKASSTITKGQVVMITGTVGASGGLRGAPATGLTAVQGENVLGIATQDIANNNWGYITWFGEVKKVNTTGGVEAWIDGQILYYNPAVAGGLTKNIPTAPNPKVIVAAVIHAATNGILFVRPTFGSVLGATDSNVEISGLAGGDLLQYDSSQSRWENVPASSVVATSGGVPITKTADFTVGVGEGWLINNKSGSTCTVTLPAAATYPGRYITFQNYQAQNLVSASSNVVPQGGGAAGTAILIDVAGNWATLVSNGTNWVIMQAASFNNLLY
jgi:hypothetical protein